MLPTATAEERLQRVADAALPGEQTRGNGGVVVVTAETSQYKLLTEIESEELRDQLEDMLTEHGRSHVVVVEETLEVSTQRAVAHVWMAPRSELVRRASSSIDEA